MYYHNIIEHDEGAGARRKACAASARDSCPNSALNLDFRSNHVGHTRQDIEKELVAGERWDGLVWHPHCAPLLAGRRRVRLRLFAPPSFVKGTR
jgi:hypothetical protein